MRWERSKSSRIEEARAREKDNGRVCVGIQKSSKRKWI